MRYTLADYAFDSLAARGHVGRHVGRTEGQLSDRLQAAGLEVASSFANETEAVACIDLAMQAGAAGIFQWLQSGGPVHRITATLPTPCGLVVTRHPRRVMLGTAVRVVLRRTASGSPPCYVETAFLLP